MIFIIYLLNKKLNLQLYQHESEWFSLATRFYLHNLLLYVMLVQRITNSK